MHFIPITNSSPTKTPTPKSSSLTTKTDIGITSHNMLTIWHIRNMEKIEIYQELMLLRILKNSKKRKNINSHQINQTKNQMQNWNGVRNSTHLVRFYSIYGIKENQKKTKNSNQNPYPAMTKN